MAKKCPPGKYYCFDDKKCKKIPRGYHIGARGYLARDTKDDDSETKKNGNGSSNGNGNGGNGAGNGNGGSGGNGGGNGGGGMGESIVYETLNSKDKPFVKKLVGKLRKGSKTHAKQADDLEKAMTESSNPRIPRKKGQPAKSKKHSDLYTDEDPKGTIHGLGFKDVAKAKASVSKIRNSSRSHAHKIQAAVAMEQRAREMGKTSEAAVYRKYINSMKKKTKRMNEAVNAAQQAAIAIDMKKKGKKPKNIKEEESAPNNEQQSRKNQKPKLTSIGDILNKLANNPEKKLKDQIDQKKRENTNEGMYNHSDVGLITNAVVELEDGLKTLKTITYDSVDQLMQGIAKRNDISPTLLHNQFKAKHFTIPDNWAIRYRMNKMKGIEEATMTPAQKRKDTMLKKKYDKSDMKKSMQKQYGKEEGKKVYFATIRKQAMEGVEDDKYNVSEEGLRDWFGKSSGTTKSGRKVRGWVQVGGKYDGKPCARQPGQKSTPKCVSSSKRRSMSKSERDSAARRKRAADPNQPQKSGAAKPTNVSTDPKRKMKKEEYTVENIFKGTKGDGYLGKTPIPNPIRLTKDVVDTVNRQTKKRVDDINKISPGSGSVNIPKPFNKKVSPATTRYLGIKNEEKITEKKKFGSGGDPIKKPGFIDKALEKLKNTTPVKKIDTDVPTSESFVNEAKDKKGKGSGTKDACYHKVKSRYSVWPSAYASGALVKCRKVGAANWGNKSKNEGFSPMQVAALESAGMIEIKEGQKCWKGYEKKGTKMMFGKRYNNCVKKKATKEEVEHIDEKMINVTPNAIRKRAAKSIIKKDLPKVAAGAGALAAGVAVGNKMTSTNEGVEFLKREKEKKKSSSEYLTQRDAGKLAKRKMAKKDQEKVNFLEPEETNESKTRLVKNGHTYKVVLTWRGKTYMVQMFVPSVSRPTRQQVEKEVQKIYPDAKLMSFLPRDLEPGEPTVMMGEGKKVKRDEYGDPINPDGSYAGKKNEDKNPKDEKITRSEEIERDMTYRDKKNIERQEQLKKASQKAPKPENKIIPIKTSKPKPENNTEEVIHEDDMKGMSVKSGHKRPTKSGAGMTAKGVAAYRRRNPGSKLQTAVTGKVKKGSKDAKRRKSYCARSAGQMKKFPKAAKDPNSRLRQARRRWKC